MLLVLSTLLSVFACTDTGGTGDNSGDEGGEGGTGESTVRQFDAIVYADGIGEGIDFRTFINNYQKLTGKRLMLYTEAEREEEGNEVLFGSTDRHISKLANRAMREYKRSHILGRFDVAYAICADGGDVAVVFDNNYIADLVVNKFIELSKDKNLAELDDYVESGFMTVGSQNAAVEQEKREQQLSKIAEQFGVDTASAVREHLALATPDFYVWLANLYEPRTCICDNYDELGYRMCLLPKDEEGNYLCHGGGFYYCNSARDHEGYYIDIESSVQALSFLTGSGMLSSATKLDKQIQNDMLAFAKSLQSEDDGYFYHPQWGKNISVSRRGRDLSWATSIISTFGSRPLYNTPNGVTGELGAPGAKKDSASVSPLSESSAAVAVSKVILCAVWPSHLATLADFELYLKSFNLKSASYSAGNTFSSQTGQILQRDREGLANGEFHDTNGDGKADDGLVAAFERHFNAAQNPENGLWEDSVHYNSVNGLMKIGGAYNGLGIKLPNAEAAFNSAVEMVLLPVDVADCKNKKTTGSVDVYNPWVAISGVMSNMRKFGEAEEAAALKASLQENAAEMIRVTTSKAKKFVKDDGSYGYTWNSPPSASQGAPVCPSGFFEGDVNGGGIALNGIWGNMTSALGISMKLYSPSDGEKFIYIIENLDPVIKYKSK